MAEFQIGVDLLDDRVTAMGLVGGDGVQVLVVRKAGNRQVSNRLSWPGLHVEVGHASDDQPARHLSALFFELNAVNLISATSACRLPF